MNQGHLVVPENKGVMGTCHRDTEGSLRGSYWPCLGQFKNKKKGKQKSNKGTTIFTYPEKKNLCPFLKTLYNPEETQLYLCTLVYFWCIFSSFTLLHAAGLFCFRAVFNHINFLLLVGLWVVSTLGLLQTALL